MGRSVSVVVVLVAAVLAPGCGGPGPGAEDGATEALEARQEAFFSAMGDRDADRAAALFSEDAVLQVANMPPVQGRPAIHAFYGNLFGFLSSSSATPERLQVAGSGDLAYGVGQASNRFQGPEGAVEYLGKYLLVWQRVEGEWMVVAYAVSSNAPNGSR